MGQTKLTISEDTLKEALRQYFQTHAPAFLEDGADISKIVASTYAPIEYTITWDGPKVTAKEQTA